MFNWLKKILKIATAEEENEELNPEERNQLQEILNATAKNTKGEFFEKLRAVFDKITDEDFKSALARINLVAVNPKTLDENSELSKSAVYSVGLTDGIAAARWLVDILITEHSLLDQKCTIVCMNSLTLDEHENITVFVDNVKYPKPISVVIFDFENDNIIVQVDTDEPLNDNAIVKVVKDGVVIFEGTKIEKDSDVGEENLEGAFPNKKLPKYNN